MGKGESRESQRRTLALKHNCENSLGVGGSGRRPFKCVSFEIWAGAREVGQNWRVFNRLAFGSSESVVLQPDRLPEQPDALPEQADRFSKLLDCVSE